MDNNDFLISISDKALDTIYSASVVISLARDNGASSWDEFTVWLDLNWDYIITEKGLSLFERVWRASSPDA